MATATKPGGPGRSRSRDGAAPGVPGPPRGSVQSQLEKSFAGAQQVAQRYPQYASKITAAAKSAFLSGDQWAYTAAIIGVVLGAALVFFMFPQQEAELALLARYQAEDRQ